MSIDDDIILVTGGAGFIGSHIVDKLIDSGKQVIVFDNLSSGNIKFIENYFDEPNFTFINGDLLNINELKEACKDVNFIYHVAANPDVKLGASDTRIHFDQNIAATYNLLEAMRINNVKNIAFTSTSTVYGEAKEIPTPENYGPLIPISLYGASKLACEALITSYSHTFDMKSWIFRFANIIGKRSNHGIIFDFIEKLRNDPNQLEILGDGQQAKSYLHVKDCVDGIFFAISNSSDSVNIFNIGSKDTIKATQIGEIVAEEMKLKNIEFSYTGGKRGWKGDVPRMALSIEKLRSLGWNPTYSSEESVKETVRSIMSGL
ncbi:NAD-dependent epimerase/dehydratase family protein [Methanohalophilus sp. RSK]|uniref:NAD-dependent epimerase/dehydratase family protein n=1 Tax=Methanohalophilus sp. RSK TaxID=2485783 RepID=UPI000F43AD3B|nr:NAD-dependent epimerase/dehydratase family protein [Methanohalophilus sp. RSK]RNI15770.1 NAD-dependent epimerase/dehydratase family protein [Methanohalophilus sp. RSK]